MNDDKRINSLVLNDDWEVTLGRFRSETEPLMNIGLTYILDYVQC